MTAPHITPVFTIVDPAGEPTAAVVEVLARLLLAVADQEPSEPLTTRNPNGPRPETQISGCTRQANRIETSPQEMTTAAQPYQKLATAVVNQRTNEKSYQKKQR